MIRSAEIFKKCLLPFIIIDGKVVYHNMLKNTQLVLSLSPELLVPDQHNEKKLLLLKSKSSVSEIHGIPLCIY